MLLLEGISQLYKFKLIVQNAVSPDWIPKCVNAGSGSNGGQGAVVISKETALPKNFPPLVLHNYNFQYTVFVENTGHSIKLNLSSDDEKYDQNDLPAISGSVLKGRYILENVHFQWEADHMINGCSFPLEGHFVHVPEDPNCRGKYVVLSVLYQASKCAGPTFDVICDGVDAVSRKVGCPERSREPIAFKCLLPKNTSNYFTYEDTYGDEIVFIIMANPARIGRRQLAGLTTVYDDKGELISNKADAESTPSCEEDSPSPVIYYSAGWLETMKIQLFQKIWKKSEA